MEDYFIVVILIQIINHSVSLRQVKMRASTLFQAAATEYPMETSPVQREGATGWLSCRDTSTCCQTVEAAYRPGQYYG